VEHHTFTDKAVPTAYGPYSHAVIAGNFVFVAGQTARDLATGRIIEGDVAAQTRRALEIICEILGELGLAPADIVRATVYLANMQDFDAMNRVYASVIQPPYPARSTVEVGMPFGALVGIEVTAYRGDRHAETTVSERSSVAG
jgi:2-iminobutanoate/2-iminopropanoate deaminase